MTEYRWSTHAYAKVAFHCAKYLTNPLSGVLLGAEKDGHVNIIDAIPLFHTPVMAPMMEVALLQIDEYATKHDLKLIGTYTAAAMKVKAGSEPAVPSAISKITLKLKSQFENAFVFVAGEDITQSSAEIPNGRILCHGADGWTTPMKQIVENETPLKALLAASFQAQHHREVHDFDEHLDSPANDWLNTTLFASSKDD